jgi:hypothetical protein
MATPRPKEHHRTLARLVTGARPAFEAAYDRQNTLAGMKAEAFKVVALGADDDQAAFARAFAAAEAAQWLTRFVRIGVEAGILDGTALLVGPGGGNQPEVAMLQNMINAARAFANPAVLAKGITQTIPRICRIVIDGGAITGTGFLVGPQTVLTAWHVVHSLLDGNRIRNGSAARIFVEFDRIDYGDGVVQPFRVPVADQWLEASSPAHASELLGAANGRLIGTSAPQFGQLADCFDFAVLRLRKTPGRDRGHVPLGTSCWPPAQEPIHVFQHPLEFAQRMDSAVGAEFDPADQERLRFFHRVNTLGGSSGGLCVNENFEAVGLHQAGQFDAQGNPTRNRAIPIVHIAKRCGDILSVNVEDDPLWVLKDRRTPVFGRETFQRLVWQAVRGETRIIQVNGVKDSGKTFSLDLMNAMLAANSHQIVNRSAANVSSDAHEFATALLRDIEPSGPAAAPLPLPPPDEAATTQAAYVHDQLLPKLLPRLAAAAAGRLLWIVIDDLDIHDITPGATRELLNALYARLATQPYLRFVLLGREGALEGVDPRQLETDRLERILESEITIQVRRRYVAANQLPPGDNIQARQLLATVDRAGARTARTIAHHYMATVDPVIPAVE